MWDLKVIDTNKSLYLAIADALERDIDAGILNPGDMLPTHRALAKKVGVTVTTATRAYAEAERRGLISAVVGKGTFVTADAKLSVSVIDTHVDKMPIEMGLTRPLYNDEADLRPVLEHLLQQKHLSKFMQYSDPQGLFEHREAGARWIRRFGVPASPDTVLLTAGGQHAMFCIFYAIFEHGDRLAVDCLTYPGAKAAARRLGLRLEGVMMDEQGMIPEELDALCKRHSIKGIYISGRVQNPTNRIMGQQRREELARIIRKYNLNLVESDSYGFLSDEGNQTLSSLVPHNAIYVSSLSKAFYAGLRVAFVTAPERHYKSIAQGIVDSMLLASPLCAEVACECISMGTADTIIRQKRMALSRRMDAFRETLGQYDYESYDGCMAVWLALPEHWTCTGFELAAERLGLRVYAASRFAVGPVVPPNHIRISLSGPEDMATFSNGLDVLSGLLSGPSSVAEKPLKTHAGVKSRSGVHQVAEL